MAQGPTYPDRPESSITDRKVAALKIRLMREATLAIAMLEQALAALWSLDVDAARAVRQSDDRVDLEEVAIEQACYEIMALRAPYARTFRILAFVLRVNADFERVADHACSIAKAVVKIAEHAERSEAPTWPTALLDLGERVPAMCHQVMRAVMDENADAARALVATDENIDRLDRRLFDEAREMMRGRNGIPASDEELAMGMLIYRIGRELERVGDLMAAIAEDVVFLATGSIIRHSKRRGLAPGQPGGQPPAIPPG